MIEPEDRHLVLSFIVYDHLFKFLEKELEAVKQSDICIKKPHISYIHSIINIVHKEFRLLKGQIRQHEIKIHNMKEEKSLDVLIYPFSCRGYFDEQSIGRNALRNKLINKLSKLYINSYS